MFVVLDNLSLGIDEELGEVPLDQITIGVHDLVHWRGIVTVNVQFLGHWEVHTILGDKSLDLLWCAWLLCTELIARNGNDLETLSIHIFVHLN